jgi:hypothetical protein
VAGRGVLEVAGGEVEGPEAPGGGDAVVGVEVQPIPVGGVAIRVVEPVETDGDFDSGVVGDVGGVEVIRVPGNYRFSSASRGSTTMMVFLFGVFVDLL